MSQIKKYIGFLILLVPILFATIIMEICTMILCIIGLPLFIGAWLLGWINWDDYIELIVFPFGILKDLFNEIL